MIVETLLGLALKSALVAASALLVARLLRRRPPTEAVSTLRLGVVGMGIALLLSGLAPLVAIPLPWPIAIPPTPTFGPTGGASLWEHSRGGAEASAFAARQASWLLFAYEGVAGVLLARLVLGVLTLSAWSRSARTVTATPWVRAVEAVSTPGRRPRLLVSPRCAAPLSWGLGRGVILLDPTTHARVDAAAAVIAHEVAHLERRDWLFLMLSRLMVVVFWFNPLAWMLDRALSRASELAADARALRRVARVDYAQTLVDLGGGRPPRFALGLGGRNRDLAARVRAVLLRTGKTEPSRFAWMFGAFSLAAALPIAGFQPGIATTAMSSEDFAETAERLPPLPSKAGPSTLSVVRTAPDGPGPASSPAKRADHRPIAPHSASANGPGADVYPSGQTLSPAGRVADLEPGSGQFLSADRSGASSSGQSDRNADSARDTPPRAQGAPPSADLAPPPDE